MTSPDNNSDSGIDRDEFVNRFYERYPRLSRVFSSLRQNPLSGNTLRMMIKGEEEIRRDEQQVAALETPVMWKRNAPIVISQYANYASDKLPQFWNATLPEINERYGEITRYEHHDVPTLKETATEYKLATVGRAIQHKAGNEGFWVWFDHLMIDGVSSVTESYDLAEDIGIGVERDYLERAVKYDVYNNVIWNDVDALMGKENGQTAVDIQQQLEREDPVFIVFVNGMQVQPSYDSIVGAIEEIRASHAQHTENQQQTRQEQQAGNDNGRTSDP